MVRRLKKRGDMSDRMDIALKKFSSRMTSYPPGMCPLVMYRSILQMSMNQSCGKCVPCRDGLVEAERMLCDILNGDATEETLVKLKDLCTMISEIRFWTVLRILRMNMRVILKTAAVWVTWSRRFRV